MNELSKMPHAPLRLGRFGTAANLKGYICNSSPVMTGGTMATATLVDSGPDELQDPGSAKLTSGAPSLGMTRHQPVVGYRIASLMDAHGAGS